MSTEPDTVTGFGLQNAMGWGLGGAIGGIIGATVLGIVLWLTDPLLVTEIIPASYGLEPGAVVGWMAHLVNGAILGVVFGLLVTRQSILSILRMDVETEALSRTTVFARLVAAGFVYGLAVWAILPLILLPLLTGTVVGEAAAGFPIIAVETLIGHVLFGVVLGAIFSVIVDVEDRSVEEPFEE